MKANRNEISVILLVILILCFISLKWMPVDFTKAQAQDSAIVAVAKSVGVVNFTGYQTITPNSTSASSLTIPQGNHTKAFITLETADVRFRIDGTAPTTTEGHRVYAAAYQNITLNTRSQLEKFKVISIAAHGTIKISYGE